MKRKKDIYEENKAIIADENSCQDKNTIALINLIATIIVETTLAQSENIEEGNYFSSKEDFPKSK